MSVHVVITTTAASADEAERIARALVAEKLAACVQMSAINSVYIWRGAETVELETLLTIKTRAALQEKVAARIRALHSYDVPEVIATPIAFGSAAYLDWIDAQTEGQVP